MIKKLILIVFLLIVIGIGAAYFYRNSIVETAVEESGDYVLSVPTDLGSANLNIGGGSLELNDYKISNPEGYEGEHFLYLKHGMLDVNSGSVFDDEVIIDSIVLEGFQLSLEQINQKGNYLDLLNKLKQFDISSSSDSEQKFKVNKLILRDIGVDAKLNILDNIQEKSFKVDDFTLSNVGGSNGTTVSGLIKTVVSELLTRTSSTSKSFGIDLNAKAEQLQEEGKKKIEDAAKDQLKKIGL